MPVKIARSLPSAALFPDVTRMAQGLMKLKRAPHECSAHDRKGEISQHYHLLS